MAEQRYQAVLAVISDGETVTDVAARFGVARKTVHEWLAKVRGWWSGEPGRSFAPTQVVSAPDRVAVGGGDRPDAALASGVGSSAASP